MKTIVLYTLLLFSSTQLMAQTSFVFASSASGFTPVDSANQASDAKFKRAQKVFNDLVAARGDFRAPIPKFILSNSTANVAWMDYPTRTIGIEEKAFDVCMEMGNQADAALASLLGHELIHYYEKHGWRRSFADDFSDLNVGAALGSINDRVAYETQADYLGGFLAYSAGYPVFTDGPELTAKLYKAYSFPDKLPIYPSLQERQELSRRSAQKLQKLVHIFETANLLTATAKYQEAKIYYNYILNEYQSRELFNNLGVCTTLEALELFTAQELPFQLPLQLDLEGLGGRSAESTEALRKRLLTEALRHFEAAIQLDPSYAPAYLNKACVYVLLNDLKRARFYAEVEAPEVAKAQNDVITEREAIGLQGIIEWYAGDKDKCRTLLESSAAMGSKLAANNLKKLNNQQPDRGEQALAFDSEKIDNLSLLSESEAQKIPVNIKSKAFIDSENTYYEKLNASEHARFYRNENGATRKKTYFLVTQNGYTGATANGIKIGAKDTDITNPSAYGDPVRVLLTTRGQIMVYNQIIFFLDNQNTVWQWAIYL